MKASELIEKLEKAINIVGDVDVKGISYEDDYLGGVTLGKLRSVMTTDKGDIVVAPYDEYSDAYYKFEVIK